MLHLLCLTTWKKKKMYYKCYTTMQYQNQLSDTAQIGCFQFHIDAFLALCDCKSPNSQWQTLNIPSNNLHYLILLIMCLLRDTYIKFLDFAAEEFGLFNMQTFILTWKIAKHSDAYPRTVIDMLILMEAWF